MEICFVPDNDYGKFLRDSKLVGRHRGEIVDRSGRKLGEHDGVEFYTVGQRRGLGISTPEPVYVIELDPASNRVVVGDDADLNRADFRVNNCNWIPWESPPATVECVARIRYNHPGVPATVTPVPGDSAVVHLHEPARAVTPGQACVFYGGPEGDHVLGGGWIAR